MTLRVEIVERADRDDVAVYLFHETAAGRTPIRPMGGPITDVVLPHAELPVSLVLSREVYLALRAEMIGDALHRDDALADARDVRDRLLTLVEIEWERRE